MKNRRLLALPSFVKTVSGAVLLVTGLSFTSMGVYAGPSDELKKAKSEKQAEAAIKFRKAILQLLKSNMGPLGAMAKGNIPMDADVIATSAERIEFLGSMMHDYFAVDTSAFDIETGAKNDIWKNYQDFTTKIDDLVDAAGELQELVANGEDGKFRSGIGNLGGTCKACHDEYEKE